MKKPKLLCNSVVFFILMYLSSINSLIIPVCEMLYSEYYYCSDRLWDSQEGEINLLKFCSV